jgi:hypothetical protein
MLEALSDDCPARYSHAQFVAQYTGQKRIRYQQASKDIEDFGLDRKDAHIRGFLKFEKTGCNYTETGKDWGDRICRVISPRSPKYCLELGTFLCPIEKKVMKTIDMIADGYRSVPDPDCQTILKGLNARDMARCIARKFEKFHKPMIILFDATRWDQHVSVEALEFEHAYYRHIYRNHPQLKQLRWLLKQQLTNDCTISTKDARCIYKRDGGRMSGDINTSMGNCFVMSALTIQYFGNRFRNFEIGNNGDDTFAIVEESEYNSTWTVDHFKDYWKQHGFTMKVDGIETCLQKLDFCQHRPLQINGDWLMVRDHDVGISKSIISLKPLSNKAMVSAFEHNVGAGGVAINSGVPVAQAFYAALRNRALKSGRTIDQLTKYDKYFDVDRFNYNTYLKGMSAKESKVTSANRAEYAIAFDYIPAHQKVLEAKYRRLVKQA